jgi:predicted RNA-binding protein with PIN domain
LRDRDRGDDEIIVDGNNLMYTIDETRELAIQDIRRGRSKLSGMIKRYALQHRANLTIVYDGYARESSTQRTDGPIRILISDAPETADEMILKLIRSDSDATRLTIVTSDLKDIGDTARKFGAKVLTSGRFADRIGGSRTPRSRGTGRGRRGRPKVDEKKIEEWLQLIRRELRK